MEDTAVVEDTKPATKAAKAQDSTPNSPSVRSVVVGGTTVAAVLAAAAVFVAGGWIALAVAGGATAVGAVGVAAARNPNRRSRSRRPRGLLPIGRGPRTTARPGTGKASWPLTGNQSKRAASKGRSGGRSTGAGRGIGLPKLPALTSKGRARKAASAARGASKRLGLPVAKSARPVPTAKRPATKATAPARKATATPKASTAARKATARKPAATKPGAAPRTPSKTPSRAGQRPRLTTGAKGTRRAPGSVLPKATRPTARKGAASKLASSRGKSGLPKLGSGGKVLPKLGSGGKAVPKLGGSRGGKLLPKLGSSARRGGTSPLGRRSSGGAGRGRVGLPKVGTGRAARRLGSGSTSTPRKATAGARRLGTAKRVPMRIRHRVPNRTPSRPVPARRGSVRRLLKTAVGVPKRSGLRLKPPTLTARRNARRTLARHTGIGTRRLLKRAAVSPYRRLRPWLRHLDQRARGLTAPGPIPHIDFPTTDPTPTIRRYRNPVPQLTGRRAADTPKENPAMSNPNESVTEAFAQMAQYTPESATEIGLFLQQWNEMFAESAASLKALADRWSDEQPLAAPVIEAMQQVGTGLASLSDVSSEAYATMRAAHEDDFRRLEEPRPNEAAWDTTRNN